jgi:O-antigen/teichoic acid export membrane protein
LKQRFIKAGVWVISGHAAGQVLRLVSNLILTRLLVPEMFGVMALANILLIGVWLFSDLGLKQNIVQSHRGDDQLFLNTAWAVQIIRGAIMWMVGILLAISIYLMNQWHWFNAHSAYAEPLLPIIIVIISSGFLIAGFDSTKLATASRHMLLKRVTMIQLVAQLTGTLSMLAWAWHSHSIWALTISPVVSSIVELILSHTILPGENNKWQWDPSAFHEIFHFGKWIFLTSILGYLVMNGDRIVLGNLIDAKMLGLYSISFMLYNSLQEVIFKVGDGVGYPALSEVIRHRPHDIQKVYYKIRKPMDIGTSLLMGLLIASGDLVIKFLYDDRYHDSSYMLQILSVALFMTRFNLDKNFFMAIGKPKLTVPIQMINLFVMYIMLPIVFSHYGMRGALWAIGAGSMLALPLIYYYKIENKLCDFTQELKYIPLIAVGYGLGWVISAINQYFGLIL